MRDGIYEQHWTNENEIPAGGCSGGKGFTISWQNGPLGRNADRKQPNGAFVEDIIIAVIGRIEFYQQSKFICDDNEQALVHLRSALAKLENRTRDREARNVEGIYKI